ncbi:DUF5318 family protein [Staphylococcus chromogenes]|nr:DUF5318 family protein [Staphylococcus chromogenes]
MLEFSNVVSHQLDRKRLLAQWRMGAITRDSVCDADFLLVTAAKFHGALSKNLCPICESDALRVVLWIFGDHLGTMSGTARNLAEIERIAQQRAAFTVHTVEVCPDCKWNHLLQAATASWQS